MVRIGAARASVLRGLSAAAVVAATVVAAPAVAQETKAQLEQQIQQQQALNDALKQRMAKLEELLKTDVCANPAAAEALLAEKIPEPQPQAPPIR